MNTNVHTLPQGTMAQALAALPINTRHEFTDPQDVLDSHFEFQESFHGRVASALGFTIDKMVLRQAKTVIFTRWKEVDKSPDVKFNDWLQGIGAELAHDSLYDEHTPEHVLAQLLALRGQWHDHAYNIIGESYEPDTLRAQAFEEGEVREVDSAVRQVFEINAQFWCQDEGARTQFLADALEADKLQQAAWREADKRLAPTILEVIRYAGQHADHATRFDQLPDRVQASLFTSAANSIKRLVVKHGRRMLGQPIEYAKLNAAARNAVNELESIVTNKFSDKGELENVKSQAQTDIDRAAKRKAWNTFE